MKFPEQQQTGITTLGATGVAILVLCGLGHISAWWMVLSSLFIVGAIGIESGKGK